MNNKIYDLIIIGIGPAGLTASIYASRYRLNYVVLGSKEGGALSWAAEVENYPGFKKITGLDLTNKMIEQAKAFGAEILTKEVTGIEKKDGLFIVKFNDDQSFQSKTIIIATGTERRKLNVPGEAKYLGRGVSYCTTCDANFFKGKVVAMVGGSNAAALGAYHLSKIASKIYLIYRKKPLRVEPFWQERIEKETNIEIIYETNVVEILGNDSKVTGVKLDKFYKGNQELRLDGVFIEIGGVPGTELVKSLGVDLDESGFIKVASNMKTNIEGVFAAGDVANATGEFHQIVTATAEGALAANSVYKYLKGGQK